MEHRSQQIIKIIKKFDNEIGKTVAHLNQEKQNLLDAMDKNPGESVDFTDYMVAISQVQEFCDYLKQAYNQSLKLKENCIKAKELLGSDQ